MKAYWNKVIVKPEPNKDSVSGFLIPTESGPQRHFSIYGEVVSAGPTYFYERKIRKMMRRPVGSNKFWSRFYTGFSTEFLTGKILRPGDMVYFNHVAHFNQVDGNLIIPYDLIYAIDGPDGMVPLNGNIFVEMIEHQRIEEISKGIFFEYYDKNRYGLARVVFSGSPTKYAYGPRWDFNHNVPPGSIVTFRKKASHRMELDYHNTLTGQQSSLFVIKRKDILTWTSAS